MSAALGRPMQAIPLGGRAAQRTLGVVMSAAPGRPKQANPLGGRAAKRTWGPT